MVISGAGTLKLCSTNAEVHAATLAEDSGAGSLDGTDPRASSLVSVACRDEIRTENVTSTGALQADLDAAASTLVSMACGDEIRTVNATRVGALQTDLEATASNSVSLACGDEIRNATSVPDGAMEKDLQAGLL